MPGGILQLVAHGIEDLILFNEPEITMFKTVYRRHTNFSIEDVFLNFKGRPSFGDKAICKLKPKGDLIHKIYIKVDLPEIQMKNREVKKSEISGILAENNITYNPSNPNNVVDEDCRIEVLGVIDDRIDVLNSQIAENEDIVNEILLFNPDLDPEDRNITQYYNAILDRITELDSNSFIIDFLKTQFVPSLNDYTLSSSNTIRQKIVDKLSEDTDISEKLIFKSPFIQFISFVERKDFIPNAETDLRNLFENVIRDQYENFSDYSLFDTYKIFTSYLQSRNTFNYDVELVRQDLLDHMNLGIVDNFRLIINTFNTLADNINIVIFKKYSVTGNPANPFNSNELFRFDTENISSFVNRFRLPIDPSRPENYEIFYQDYINLQLNIFKDNLFFFLNNSNYFHQFSKINFWEDINVGDLLDDANYSHLRYLNAIPIVVNRDINSRIQDLLVDNGDIDGMSNIILNLNNRIESILFSRIFPVDVMSTLDNTSGLNPSNADDLVLFSLVRNRDYVNIDGEVWRGFTASGERLEIPDYVLENYSRTIEENRLNSADPNNKSWQDMKDIVLEYKFSVEPDDPNIQNPLDDGDNVNDGNQPFTGGSNLLIFGNTPQNDDIDNFELLEPIVSQPLTIRSGLWDGIYNNLSTGYNSLYRNQIFDFNVLVEELGLLATLSVVFNIGFPLQDLVDINNFNEIQYTSATPTTILSVTNKLSNDSIPQFRDFVDHYNQNKNLLRIENIVIPRQQFYFEKFQTVYEYILEVMINNPEFYMHTDATILPKTYDAVKAVCIGVNDDLQTIKDNFDQFITDNMGNFDNDFIQDQIDKWNSLIVDSITPSFLFSNLSLLRTDYNELAEHNDLINYLLFWVYSNSSVINVANQNILKETKEKTYLAFINFYTERIDRLKDELEDLVGNSDKIGVRNEIQTLFRLDRFSNFAWIKRLGNFLIEEINIEINGQIIDRLDGYGLEVFHDIELDEGQERGYKNMIGDLDNLTTFNNEVKPLTHLFIPIPFWFSREYGQALPLASLINAEPKINIRFSKLDDVAFWDRFGTFVKTPRLTCKLMAQYIFLEEEERKVFFDSRLEYLIEQHRYNGDITFNLDDVDEDNEIRLEVNINNPCKEFIWVFQRDTWVNGKLRNGEMLKANWGLNEDGEGGLFEDIRIMTNGRERQTRLEGEYYNHVIPTNYHNYSGIDGLYNYVFCTRPEDHHQPSGAMNLSKMDQVYIICRLKQKVIDLMREDPSLFFHFRLYARTWAIWRVMSGLSGLLFYS